MSTTKFAFEVILAMRAAPHEPIEILRFSRLEAALNERYTRLRTLNHETHGFRLDFTLTMPNHSVRQHLLDFDEHQIPWQRIRALVETLEWAGVSLHA